MDGLAGVGRVVRSALAALVLVGIVIAGAARQTPVRAADGPTGKLAFTGSDGIYVQRMDGSARQRIWTAPANGQGTAPRWSPDGSRLAFEGPDGNIWAMNADGSGVRGITTQAVAPTGCVDDG